MASEPQIELWRRPWALVTGLQRRHRSVLTQEAYIDGEVHGAGLWIYRPERESLLIDGQPSATEDVAGFTTGNIGRSLAHLPFPVRPRTGLRLKTKSCEAQILWRNAPERPSAKGDPQSALEWAGYRLMLRARAVWDRLHDVESALADPATLWDEVRRRWTKEGDRTPPSMHVIVRQAAALSRTLDELDRAPRRILRRTHQSMPLARVQEVDRRSVAWLMRQPGETMAERAGDRQRILAVAREENFDTLENRVLRSYAEESVRVARDYLDLNRIKRDFKRTRSVEAYGRRCKILALGLEQRGVRLAEPSVTPNFVLQENVRYRNVWQSWHELLDERRREDDLWKWQARSWEEFSALAVLVALASVPGARVVATAPVTFLEEQHRGSWLAHDNPLGVFHLPAQRVVIEVQYRMPRLDSTLADFGAPIWIRYGAISDGVDFQKKIAVWPIWDIVGGNVNGEAAEIAELIPQGARAHLTAGICLRPTEFDAPHEFEVIDSAMSATLGTAGNALWQGIDAIRRFICGVALRGSP